MDTIYSAFQQIVTTNPTKPAIIEEDHTLTFEELSNRTGRTIQKLLAFPAREHFVKEEIPELPKENH